MSVDLLIEGPVAKIVLNRPEKLNALTHEMRAQLRDYAQRLRFDVAFCSVHAPGLNWVELSERMYSRVGGFVLVSDRYDAELAVDFEAERRFVLSRPIQEQELDRVLRAL